MLKVFENLFHRGKESRKSIPINSLVELTPHQKSHLKNNNFNPKEDSIYTELLTDAKYFYLGDSPNMDGISLLASARTGIVVSVNWGIFREV